MGQANPLESFQTRPYYLSIYFDACSFMLPQRSGHGTSLHLVLSIHLTLTTSIIITINTTKMWEVYE